MTGNNIADLEAHINLIPAPINKTVLKNANGQTRDIVNEVLQTYAESRNQLKQFGQFFKCDTLEQTCQNIWKFWKEKVKYKIDPDGVQWIKSPAQFWGGDLDGDGKADRFGDCKSFAIACAASLHALDIKGAFRFVSFGENLTAPTHVFVVVNDKGKEIIIDCVWHSFNSTKQWSKKWDYNMTAIYQISGIETSNSRGMLGVDDDSIQGMSAGELDLIAHKMLLEVEQGIAVKKKGIGSTHDNAYEIEIAGVNNAIAELQMRRGVRNRRYKPIRFAAYGHAGAPCKRVPQIAPQDLTVAGLFSKKKKSGGGGGTPGTSRKIRKQIARNEKGKGISKKNAKRLQALNIVVKKKKAGLLKSILNVVKAPLKLVSTTAIKVTLPKNAPFFLYTFLDAKVLAKAPDVVLQKREKAMTAKDSIIEKIGLSPVAFEKIIRAGILKRYAKQPEEVLAMWMKAANFQIGFIMAAAGSFKGAAKGVSVLSEKLGLNFKDLEESAPSPDDWGEIDAKTKAELEKDLKGQDGNKDAVPDESEEDIIKKALAAAGGNSYVPQLPKDLFPPNGGGDGDGDGEGDGSNYKTGGKSGQWNNQGDNADDAGRDPFTGEKSALNRTTELPGVTVTSTPKKEDGNSTGLLIGAAVVGLMLMGGGSKAATRKR